MSGWVVEVCMDEWTFDSMQPDMLAVRQRQEVLRQKGWGTASIRWHRNELKVVK